MDPRENRTNPEDCRSMSSSTGRERSMFSADAAFTEADRAEIRTSASTVPARKRGTTSSMERTHTASGNTGDTK